MEKFNFTCRSCGEVHDEIPALVWEYPAHVWVIPREEWPERVQERDEIYVVDGKWFFLRVVLEIPIRNSEDVLSYGLWVSISEATFKQVSASYASEETEDQRTFFAWLCENDMPPSFPRDNLQSRFQLQRFPLRPLLELRESSHPLSVAFHQGLTHEQASQILEDFMHAKE